LWKRPRATGILDQLPGDERQPVKGQNQQEAL
jgi:hypothetical protein